MTTLVYNYEEGVIAVDGRVTQGSDISTDNFNKIMKNSQGIPFVLAGNLADFDALVHSFPVGYEGMTELNAVALAVVDGEVLECHIADGEYSVTPLTFNSAHGSGSPYALSALDLIPNCTAKQAVRYAMKKDCKTGGKIRTVKVK